MSNIIGSIITDCQDDNARSRQELRFKSLFGELPTFVGVGRQAPDLEAAGLLIDQLDVIGSTPGKHEAIILVNVAPRGGTKKWDNGTPFCYFRIDNILVVSAFSGRCLSLVKKLGITQQVELLDIPTVTQAAVTWGDIAPEQAERINHTQFRSLEFLPLVAFWLQQNKPVPSTAHDIPDEQVTNLVWFTDNFGNAKTTLLADDVGFTDGKTIVLKDGSRAVCHQRLADVPKSETALTIGSSGYTDHRFIEVAVQWKDGGFGKSDSAAERHHLHVGSPVLQV